MLRCMVCGGKLDLGLLPSRPFRFWVGSHLYSRESPVCQVHDIRRACVSCQAPTESLDYDTCSACAGSPDSADLA